MGLTLQTLLKMNTPRQNRLKQLERKGPGAKCKVCEERPKRHHPEYAEMCHRCHTSKRCLDGECNPSQAHTKYINLDGIICVALSSFVCEWSAYSTLRCPFCARLDAPTVDSDPLVPCSPPISCFTCHHLLPVCAFLAVSRSHPSLHRIRSVFATSGIILSIILPNFSVIPHISGIYIYIYLAACGPTRHRAGLWT